MPIVISIPDECKALADAVTDLVTSVTRARRRADGGRAVDYAQVERELGDRTAAVERAAHRDILATLDVDAPAVVIDGRVHTRVHRAEGRYYTLAGDVVVERALYRAERNGPVVDAITLRTGALAGGWLPETATAMAHLLQQGTSREAEATGQRLGRVAYSHSSFERLGQAVGQQYAERKTAIDDALIVALDVPAEAQSVSFGIDRVSLPLEEPRRRRPRRRFRRPRGADSGTFANGNASRLDVLLPWIPLEREGHSRVPQHHRDRPAVNCRACAERFVWKHEECLDPIELLGRAVFDGHPRPSTRTIAPNGIIKGFAASPSSASAENAWTPYTLPSATRRMVSCFYWAAA